MVVNCHNSDRRVSLAPELVCPPAHTRLALPVPITLQGILGCRLDRLTHVQRMLLKAAAIIGDEFSYDTLEQSYPLTVEADQSLIQELQSLVEMGIVATAYQENTLDGQGRGESVYTFANGFLREMILSRMLSHQGKKLRTKVNEAFASHLKRRSATIHTMKPSATATLLFIDSKSIDWSPRHFVLLGDMMCWWPDEAKCIAKEVPHGIVFMREARVTADESREFAFAVNSLNWMEKNEYTRVPRSFHFVASNPKEFDVWITLLSAVAENKNTRLSVKEMSPTMLLTLRRLKEEQEQMAREMSRQLHLEHMERERKRVLSSDEKKIYEKKMKIANDHKDPTVMLQDCLGVKKQGRSLIQNDWKQRWVSLTDDGIIFRKKDWNGRDGRKSNPPTQLVSLAVGDPAVQLAGYDSTKKVFVFLLECDLWMKKGKCEWKRRKSTLSARSEDEAKKWVASINKVIAYHRTIRLHRSITQAHMASVRSPGIPSSPPASTRSSSSSSSSSGLGSTSNKHGRVPSFAADPTQPDASPASRRISPPSSPSSAINMASSALASGLSASMAVPPASPTSGGHHASGASYIYTSPPPSLASLSALASGGVPGTSGNGNRGSPPPSPGIFDLPARNLWRTQKVIPRLSDAEVGFAISLVFFPPLAHSVPSVVILINRKGKRMMMVKVVTTIV
jgi:hypothetical protein